MAKRTYQLDPPETAIEQACRRAFTTGLYSRVRRDTAPSNFHKWVVPSVSTEGQEYTVWVAHPNETVWFRRWDCNCQAGRSQHFVICIHKAAVYVRLTKENARR